ncbi:5-formyltetrahydrofolate cyclo-ligase [Polymorphobacter fuscus]|uniref:5-formyltetrahydrofolate cyclo-ligase n=1 Tax=Sandarakinorhabdus fusca TaxID=1439888 RepID=A0A7C9GVV1_9SPHN|nr:5-formyltetrahydrofolate cyclo-ligase [Polymorphobacter fuscus]KAB7648746.1 5-formyltetrahydrofolate cyclo-ligase [Polymorphobacter fuscus]MQT16314.1 5-formyltetrahydrofolate cyclo-ligase [Polymorphobacter fuscus]NJC07399.1 5-formyltetrahydrofolate cyclo-ligase [Polymorphobacter fuscus]
MTDDAKPALRQLFRDARREYVAGLSPDARVALETALAAMLAPVVAGHSVTGSYASSGDEIDPHVVERGFAASAFPRVTPGGLTFHQCRWADLRPGYAGILEPPADAPQVTPDMLLVPLIAVTPAGVRLGQGQGHYDRALAALRRRAPVRTIGLAWDVQVTDDLPRDDWDIPVDYVATPTRLFDCARLR